MDKGTQPSVACSVWMNRNYISYILGSNETPMFLENRIMVTRHGQDVYVCQHCYWINTHEAVNSALLSE